MFHSEYTHYWHRYCDDYENRFPALCTIMKMHDAGRKCALPGQGKSSRLHPPNIWRGVHLALPPPVIAKATYLTQALLGDSSGSCRELCNNCWVNNNYYRHLAPRVTITHTIINKCRGWSGFALPTRRTASSIVTICWARITGRPGCASIDTIRSQKARRKAISCPTEHNLVALNRVDDAKIASTLVNYALRCPERKQHVNPKSLRW